MSRYDPAGTGYNPEASGPTDDVRVAWSHESTGWFRGAAAPIRLGNTLYAVGDGLLALEVADGERLFARRGPYTSSPARARSASYRTDALAVAGTGGVDGLNAGGGIDVPGVDRAIGQRRWRGPERGSPRPTIEHDPTVSPVAADDAVYAPIYGTNSIVALDADSGAQRWRATHHEDDVVSVSFGRPAVRDGTLYVANWPHQVTAYAREDGTQRWQREFDAQMQLSTTATDAGVVVTTRHGVALLDPDDGGPIWRRDLEGNATDGDAAVAEGTIFLSDGLETFYALDLETGDELWSAPFEGETEPVVAGGMVYAVEDDLFLVGFDAETGTERFRYQPTEAPLSPPIVGDGRLYHVNRGRVIALEEGE
ncbi:pyrrolo-quinoline quinone [Natrarchaeobius oligotrophus]|uniref:Pyrrolo-quinoline quinone n=2 Tax=Natrarchaeobius TaxID=2501796 RepID=A0A3N6PJ33_NATCH|nr:pyrrolo-quinoline quinone [Natrarchaeobius chitinivorans]